ncbi:MAG: Arc family DNA-binding protein [Oscillospiraceae bacterium]|nr:Arc family DNA-binding protein [Oscillospiraceae bacterium]
MLKNFTLRIENELLDKLKYISKYEKRSVNSQIIILIKRCINEFENIYGTINSE